MSLSYIKLIWMVFVFKGVILLDIHYGDNKLTQVEEEDNGDFSITCTLTGEKIKQLKLDSKDNEYFSNQMEISCCADYKCVVAPVVKTTILNSTSIRTIVKQDKILGASCQIVVKCWFNQRYTLLDDISIIVANGSRPKAVQDFDCKFYNFQQVICSWTGRQNCIYTIYNLTYTPRNHHGRPSYSNVENSNLQYPWLHDRICNESTRNMVENFNYKTGVREYNCVWKLDYPDTENNYNFANYYDFKLQMSNELGYRSQHVSFAHHEHVISDAPAVTVYDTTPNSIHLLLGSRDPSAGKTPCTKYMGFEYQLSYKSEYDNQWKTANISACVRQEIFFFKPDLNIQNLKYANDNYTIKAVSVNKNFKGKGDGKSQYTVITVKTKPKIPERPPQTIIGSFEIIQEDNKNNIRVYWRKIKKTEENGDKFGYQIKVNEQGTILNVHSEKFFETYNSVIDQNYTFKIWSVNEVGLSTHYSVVFVSAKKYRPRAVERVTQMYTNNQYLFVWDPVSDQIVQNYTIFWCEVTDHLVEPTCMNNWQWTTLPPNVSNVTVPVTNPTHPNYQFAISINTKSSSSSGLFRTQLRCMLFKTTIANNMEMNVLEKNATSITITWKPNCVGLNYKLNYCPISSVKNKTCTGREEERHILNSKLNYTLNGLIQNTLYAIKLKATSSLFPGDITDLVRTAVVSSKFPLLIAMVVIVIFGLIGAAIFIKKIRNRMKIEEIEPVLSPALSNLIETSLDLSEKLNLHRPDLERPETSGYLQESEVENNVSRLENSVGPIKNEEKSRGYILVTPVGKNVLNFNDESNKICNVKQPDINQKVTIDKNNSKELKDQRYLSNKQNGPKKVRFSYAKILGGCFKAKNLAPSKVNHKSNLKNNNNKSNSSKISYSRTEESSTSDIRCKIKGYVTCEDMPTKHKTKTAIALESIEMVSQLNTGYISGEDVTLKQNSYLVTNITDEFMSEIKYSSKGYITCEDLFLKSTNLKKISDTIGSNTIKKELPFENLETHKKTKGYISLENFTFKSNNTSCTVSTSDLDKENTYTDVTNTSNKIQRNGKDYISYEDVFQANNNFAKIPKIVKNIANNESVETASKQIKESKEDVTFKTISSNLSVSTSNLDKEEKFKSVCNITNKSYVSCDDVFYKNSNFNYNVKNDANTEILEKANKQIKGYIHMKDVVIKPNSTNFAVSTSNLVKENTYKGVNSGIKRNAKGYISCEDVFHKNNNLAKIPNGVENNTNIETVEKASKKIKGYVSLEDLTCKPNSSNFNISTVILINNENMFENVDIVTNRIKRNSNGYISCEDIFKK